MNNRGFFEIGIYCTKTSENVGTLWRSAYQLGASGIFTIGKRFSKQVSDTCKASRHIPLREFLNFEEFQLARPYSSFLVGVEFDGKPLSKFCHPQRAIYLLGAEDFGLPECILKECNTIISIESVRQASYNVAVAGSIVMYQRLLQQS
jgi:tRNA G18 (ribose-2'-O)-methylase SpoU